jgi:hypothetical protein
VLDYCVIAVQNTPERIHWPKHILFNLLFGYFDLLREANNEHKNETQAVTMNKLRSLLKNYHAFEVTSSQIESKLNQLQVQYGSIVDTVDLTGGGSPIKWDYFDIMHDISKEKNIVLPVAVASSMNGLVLAQERQQSKLCCENKLFLHALKVLYQLKSE